MHKYNFQTGKPTFSCPCESLCFPACDFKSEVEVVTHNGRLKACWGSVNEVTFRKYKKNIRVEMCAG